MKMMQWKIYAYLHCLGLLPFSSPLLKSLFSESFTQVKKVAAAVYLLCKSYAYIVCHAHMQTNWNDAGIENFSNWCHCVYLVWNICVRLLSCLLFHVLVASLFEFIILLHPLTQLFYYSFDCVFQFYYSGLVGIKWISNPRSLTC
jgi:hypothetical protein